MDPNLISNLYIAGKVILIAFYLFVALFLWLLIFSAGELRIAFKQMKHDFDDLKVLFKENAPQLPAIAKADFKVESIYEDLVKQVALTILKKTNFYARFKKIIQLFSLGRSLAGIVNSARKAL